MPEIVVTESQQSEIESIRDDLEAAFVDEYGHVRIRDAIDYLLDTYTPPEERDVAPEAYERIATAEYPQLQQIAADVSGVPGSGIDADEMRGQLLSALGTAELAARLGEVEDVSESGDGGDRTETDSADEKADEPDGESASDAAVSDDGSSPRPGDADDSGDGGILSAANRLLREHEDKWREADGDEPYEVDLPDGSVESARTKDDVRQLLFRHY